MFHNKRNCINQIVCHLRPTHNRKDQRLGIVMGAYRKLNADDANFLNEIKLDKEKIQRLFLSLLKMWNNCEFLV